MIEVDDDVLVAATEALIKSRADSEFHLQCSRTEIEVAGSQFVESLRICGLSGDAVIPIPSDSDDRTTLRRAVLESALAVHGYMLLITVRAVAMEAQDSEAARALLELMRSTKKVPANARKHHGIVVLGDAYWGRRAFMLGRPGQRLDVTTQIAENAMLFTWIDGFWEEMNEAIGEREGGVDSVRTRLKEAVRELDDDMLLKKFKGDGTLH